MSKGQSRRAPTRTTHHLAAPVSPHVGIGVHHAPTCSTSPYTTRHTSARFLLANSHPFITTNTHTHSYTRKTSDSHSHHQLARMPPAALCSHHHLTTLPAVCVYVSGVYHRLVDRQQRQHHMDRVPPPSPQHPPCDTTTSSSILSITCLQQRPILILG